MSCRRRRRRRYGDDDTSSRTCRRRVKKTTRRANTSDKKTPLSAEITLKYIDFNTKRVIKTPCGRAERLTKRTFPRRNYVVHCTKTRKLNAEMATCRTNVLCTTAFLRRQRRRDVMPSATSRLRRRHIDDDTSSSSRCRRVKKDNTSRKRFSIRRNCRSVYSANTSNDMHKTTFKAEVSTCPIAA